MPREKAPEGDFTRYLDQPPTPLQARFVGWIMDKVGYDPATAKSKQEAFAAGVKFAVALRIPFQASPENKAATAQLRAERANGNSAEAEQKPAKKTAAKTAEAKPAAKKTSGKATKAANAAAAEPETKPAKKKRKAGTSTSPF